MSPNTVPNQGVTAILSLSYPSVNVIVTQLSKYVTSNITLPWYHFFNCSYLRLAKMFYIFCLIFPPKKGLFLYTLCSLTIMTVVFKWQINEEFNFCGRTSDGLNEQEASTRVSATLNNTSAEQCHSVSHQEKSHATSTLTLTFCIMLCYTQWAAVNSRVRQFSGATSDSLTSRFIVICSITVTDSSIYLVYSIFLSDFILRPWISYTLLFALVSVLIILLCNCYIVSFHFISF